MKKENKPEEQNIQAPQDDELNSATGNQPDAVPPSEDQEDALQVTLPDNPEMTDELSALLEEEKAEKDASKETADEDAKAPEEKPEKKRRERKPRDSRKLRFGAMSTVITVVVIAAVVLLNVVAGLLNDRFPLTLDLTSDKDYSLSDQGKEVAAAIENDVEVVVFTDEELFKSPNMGDDRLNMILRQFYQFSREFTNLTDGKVTFSYLDLNTNPTEAQKYSEYNVSSGSILFLSGERSKTITVNDLYTVEQSYYSGYTVSSLVEQALASGINAVGSGDTVYATILTGHGEDETAIGVLQSLLSLNGYEVDQVDFSSAQEIGENSTIVIIPGPTVDFNDNEIDRLRSWLSNNNQLGRNLMFYCNPQGNCPNLYGFLKEDYGIEVTSNLIQETDTSKVALSMTGALLPTAIPEVTDYTSNSSTGKVVFSNGLQLILHNDSDPDKASIQNIPLLTFDDSAKLLSVSDASSEEGNTSEKLFDADEYPIVGMAVAHTDTYVDNVLYEANVMVCGSLESLYYINATQYTNEELILDNINALAGRDDAVNISSKTLSNDTLSFSASTCIILGIYVFTIGIPAIMLIICLIVFLRRRHL